MRFCLLIKFHLFIISFWQMFTTTVPQLIPKFQKKKKKRKKKKKKKRRRWKNMISVSPLFLKINSINFVVNHCVLLKSKPCNLWHWWEMKPLRAQRHAVFHDFLFNPANSSVQEGTDAKRVDQAGKTTTSRAASVSLFCQKLSSTEGRSTDTEKVQEQNTTAEKLQVQIYSIPKILNTQ